ncbi:hypothetical protein M153_4940005547 [Pseudoloma neurophilia]|uniref:Uncharacterized protein n=1 Tax=Pseudoloma neurophilia TaxID=146866 RepID=A0A0R0M4B7_9MICR|nr:hypothetical protein M153_4940005547 [Pseudoloma neurophilia]
MSKSEFDKTFNTFFPHLPYHEKETKQGKTQISFLDATIEPSPLCKMSDNELFDFSNKFIKEYAEALKKQNKKLKEEKNQPQKKNVIKQETFTATLESSLAQKKKKMRIYDQKVNFIQQSSQILSILQFPKIEFNFMKENSLFSCFTTVDGVEFESEMFYEKELAKEDMCKKIVEYLDEKYEKRLCKQNE